MSVPTLRGLAASGSAMLAASARARKASGHGRSQTMRRRTVAATLAVGRIADFVIGDEMALADLDRSRADLDRIDDAELAQVADMVVGGRHGEALLPVARAARGPGSASRCADASWPNSV